MCVWSASCRSMATSHAAPNPAMSAGDKVPPRSPRSCDPPVMIGLSCTPERTKQGADALGPVDLVAREAQEVDVPVIDINRNSPRRLGRIGVEERTGVVAPSRDFRDGL